MSVPSFGSAVKNSTGNLIQDSTRTFNYDARQRVSSMTKNNKTTQYYYNGLGQRFSKNGVIYMYDLQGHLIGEYTSAGALIQETVWLNDLPIATIRPNGTGISVYFVHADELGTPRVVTDTAQKPVWRWDGDAFGRGLPNQDPLKTGIKFVYHLRYPGQYYDTESGLHYNYFRDYDPETGRYIQSDPIGLAGGFNTYAYVGGNPLNFIDPFGLTSLYYNRSAQVLVVNPEKHGQSPYYLNATSGRPNCIGCDESTRNKGPIPNGNYKLYAGDISNPNALGDLIRNSPIFGADWGDWRVPLIPNKETNTFGRSGFFLHGGNSKGSAGCIDVGGGVLGNSLTNQLLNDLKNDSDGIIPLVVK